MKDLLKFSNAFSDRSLDWREVFNIAVQYRRLIDPEQPIFWVDKMPDHDTDDGYHTEINFIKYKYVLHVPCLCLFVNPQHMFEFEISKKKQQTNKLY